MQNFHGSVVEGQITSLEKCRGSAQTSLRAGAQMADEHVKGSRERWPSGERSLGPSEELKPQRDSCEAASSRSPERPEEGGGGVTLSDFKLM